MTHSLGSIKNLTTDTLKFGAKLPVRVAARAYGVAKGAASAGAHLVTARQEPTSSWTEATTPTSTETDSGTGTSTGHPTPVNVIEELGLDPAPVDTPPAPTPITSIDAQADPDQVEVTPADVAARLAPPEGR